MPTFNPFPVYPVVGLDEESQTVREATVLTDAIVRSRGLVASYASQWKGRKGDQVGQMEPLVIAVRGDYGAGKTHLLLDAAAELHQQLSDSYPDLTVLRLTCQETDPVSWYKGTIGPRVERNSPERILVRLYARAGEAVAAEARLTEAAAAKLSGDPTSIYGLVREDLLNATAVQEKFEELLATLCKGISEDVPKALAGLVWAETADDARKWVGGVGLGAQALGKLRVKRSLSADGDAAGVLEALAAIANYVGRPFAVMIDELEHLTRYDTARNGRQNVTWLKRLIQGLASHGALAFVAGHWSAWQAEGDFMDRFSQPKNIDLMRLDEKDVLAIVRARIADLEPKHFSDEQAKTVAQIARGNVRRVLSLCHFLFRATSGFAEPLSDERVREIAEEVGDRVSIGDAALLVHEVLEQEGVSVRREGRVAGRLRFDIVGYRAGIPKIVVDLKHATTQAEQRDAARYFLDRLKEASSSAPDIIGVFAVDGSIDEEALAILRSDKRFSVLWSDLTERGAVSRLAAELKRHLETDRGAETDVARLQRLLSDSEGLLKEMDAARQKQDVQARKQLEDQRNALMGNIELLQLHMRKQERDLENRLLDLEKRRSREFDELAVRLRELTQRMESPREAQIASAPVGEVTRKLHATYEELKRRPAFYVRLRASGGLGRFAPALALMGFLLAAWPLFFGKLYPSGETLRTPVLLVTLAGSVYLLGTGGFLIWRDMVRSEKFFDYRERVLREIYLQSAKPHDLTKADEILRRCLGRYGPLRAIEEAEPRLAQELPGLELSQISVAGRPW